MTVRVWVAIADALGLVPARRTSTALSPIWRGFTYQPRTGCFVKRVSDGYRMYDRRGRFIGKAVLQRDVRRFLGQRQDQS